MLESWKLVCEAFYSFVHPLKFRSVHGSAAKSKYPNSFLLTFNRYANMKSIFMSFVQRSLSVTYFLLNDTSPELVYISDFFPLGVAIKFRLKPFTTQDRREEKKFKKKGIRKHLTKICGDIRQVLCYLCRA